MCDGGVMICMRSVADSPSAARQCSIATANARCVCLAALGMPVVPELNTSRASASGSGAANSRAPGAIGSSSDSIGMASASTG